MRDSFIDKVYNTIQDTAPANWHIPGVEPEFAEGKYCLQLYAQVYEAKQRLNDRYNGGHELQDVEDIICHMFDIMQEVGHKMYLYGATFGIPNDADTETAGQSAAEYKNI